MFVFADEYVTFEGDVDISATISEDTFSTVEVFPSTVEIMEDTTVIVTILNSSYAPQPNHYIELLASGLDFTQPTTPSNSQGRITVEVSAATPGTYTICANDITDSGLTISIIDCATLYVTPVGVPTLVAEPAFTQGNSNSLFWNSLGSNYQYNIEVSRYSDFSIVKQSSGWLSGTMFEFDSLENEVMYFYRVRARNSYGGQGGWSNVVYSVQDSEGPVIELMSVGDIGENNTVEWESGYEVEIVYRVEDNLSLESVEFLCVRQDGSKYACGTTTANGSVYTTVIQLSELEKDGIAYLFSEYSFCVDAFDTVGNQTSLCDIELSIPEWSDPGDPTEPDDPDPPAPVPTFIVRVIRDIIDTTKGVLWNAFGDFQGDELEGINTAVTVATFTVGLGSLLGGLIYIPIYLFELFLGLLSWLGLRKKGVLSGYVYDSGTKEPISQAVVRVYNLEKKLIWTDVTGSRGFFNLAMPDGEYRLEVSSNMYSFPSKSIFGKEDYPLRDIYHGDTFSVKNDIIPEFSIPLDSLELKWFGRFMIVMRGRMKILIKILSPILFLFGLVFSFYAYYNNPDILNFLIIALYIPSFLLVTKALFKKGLAYGVVREKGGGVLSNVAIGLRDVEYKKIVGKRVTDGKGRYRFVVDEGNYSIEVLDTEYTIVSVEEMDVKSLSDGAILVALDVVVKRIVVEK
ncbi:carboxypeptidase-like regulatory domain-containing protein [bacterium]|nr:carboxypeptidase-like regulatory domain-containing protein [bacterium]